MTTFRNTPEELQRLDWHVLQNGAIALYHQAGVLDGDIAWLRAQRYRIDELDASAWQSASAFHADLARALRFPAHAGSNLASLLDCLGDLEVPAEGGSAIIFRHYDRFARAEARLAQLVLDALESTSR